MTVILGLSLQFIQMGQLEFNAEQNLRDSTLGKSDHVLNQVYDCIKQINQNIQNMSPS